MFSIWQHCRFLISVSTKIDVVNGETVSVPEARFDSPGRFRNRDFYDLSNEHVSTWSASVYTLHVKKIPRGSTCVYFVHIDALSRKNIYGLKKTHF